MTTNPIIIGGLTDPDDNPQYLGSGSGTGTSTPPGSGDSEGTFIEAGCGVAWAGSGLDFIVSAGSYWILGTRYTTTGGTVTLSNGDSSNPRVDVIAVNTSGTPVVVEGTPAADPGKPSVDPVTQIELTHVDVAAAATTPGTTISNLTIYAENAGPTAEWTGSSSGSGWTLNSTTDPHAGTTHITGASVANNAYFQGAYSANLDINLYERLVYYIKVTTTWNASRWLRIGWFANGVQKGQWVDVRDTNYGFSRTASSSYQVVIIPTLAFNIPSGTMVNQLRMQDTGGAISFRLDDILLQLASTGQQTIAGITQEQADARYQRIPSIEPFHFAGPLGRL
jgi:hypothetical protein